MNQQPRTPQEVDSLYKYWRINIFIAIYVGYAVYYFTRKSLNFAAPLIIEEGLITKIDLGIISTAFAIIYGASKFLSGIMSDNSNPRYFLSIGLIITGILNIVFASTSNFYFWIAIWGLNAFFQGWGWPPIAKILNSWYSRSERGKWWSIWNTSHNLGGALIPILVGVVAAHMGWRWGMYVPGIFAIVVGLLVMTRLQDTPQTMGLPSVGEWRKDELEIAHEKSSEQGLSTWQILTRYVISNKFVWLLAASYLLVYVVRQGINDWSNLYMREVHHYDLTLANSAVSFFEVGGFIGTIVAGWGSDILFKGNRNPMNLIFALGILGSIASLYIFQSADNYYLQSVIFFFVGFFIFGPQMLIGMAVAEASHKRAAGTSTGFVSFFAYLGAALAGFPLAWVIQNYHWNGFFITLITCSVLTAILLLPLVLRNPAKVQHKD